MAKGSTFVRWPISGKNRNDEICANDDGEPSTGEWIVDLYRRAEFSTSLTDSPRRVAAHSCPNSALVEMAGKPLLF